MYGLNTRKYGVFIFLTAVVLFSGCTEPNLSAEKKSAPASTTSPTSGQAANTRTSTACDESLWQHVYDPSRLDVTDRCKTVTGVIDELDQNGDGDTHMLLKLDAGQDDLLTKRNRKKKDGDLVIEVVCGGPVTDKKAKDACKDYTSPIKIPRVGDHVEVTGSYVIDTHNDWAEIHPVSAIVPK